MEFAYEDVESFLLMNEVEESVANELRESSVEVQAVVLAAGDLVGGQVAQNTAELRARLWGAQPQGEPGSAEEVDELTQLAAQVEEFILANGLDEGAADFLRACEPHIQQAAMARGDLSTARNPSAALLKRVKDEKGGGIKGGPPEACLGAAAVVIPPRQYVATDMYATKGWGSTKGGGQTWQPYGPPAWGGGGGAKGPPVVVPAAKGKGKGSWYPPAPSWGPPGPDIWGPPGPDLYGPPAAAAHGKRTRQDYGMTPVPASNQSRTTPAIHWLTVPDSQLAQEGLSVEGPAIVYDKAETIFQSSTNMLSELVGDISTAVTIQHDADWQQFPDLGEALKQASGEEQCIAVAISAEHGKWAVGAASGWKGRESAVKLALCVAIAAGTERFESIASQYPEFQAMCVAAGLAPAPTPAVKGGKGAYANSSAYGGKGAPPYDPEEPVQNGTWGGDSTSMAMGGVSAPAVHWVILPEHSRLVLEGFPADGPAIAHDKAFQEYFRNAHHILSDIVGDMQHVAFHHDPDWDKFPEVAEAIKRAGAEESCFCVVTCPSQGKWALGIGSGWKTRESSGKLALSVALAKDSGKLDQIVATYPEFGPVCASAGIAPAHVQKRRKMGGW